jgi:hypothetical protein
MRSIEINVSDMKYLMARDLSLKAVNLDSIKGIFTPEQRAKAGHIVDEMHELVSELAGDRVHEIYGVTE